MGRLSRGLALMLVAFGGLFAGLGQWLSVSHGPATTSFESLRRFAAALDADQMPLAAWLGAKSVASVSDDKRWAPSERAELAYRAALANDAAGRAANALVLARIASNEVSHVNSSDFDLVIAVATLHGDLALKAGDKLEAACTYGLALERLGPDRVAHPEQRLHPHPAIERLTDHLIGQGKAFALAPATRVAANQPLTSCNLTADFYAERKDYAAAASISEAVLAQAENNKTIGPEIHAALLQDSAHIAELDGQVETAKARAKQSVDVLAASGLSEPRVIALETLATLHTNWSDTKGAEPYLQEAINLKQKLDGPNSPGLVSPLLALGYARLDTKDASGAEVLFKHALSIADTKSAKTKSATLEATLALAELYDNQGRAAEAASMHGKAAALQKSGVTLRIADVEDIPIVQPSAKYQLVTFDIRYDTGETNGYVPVALSPPRGAAWTSAWPANAFAPASERFAEPLVYASRSDTDEKSSAPPPSLFFIPGQGTDLSENAGRLARLDASVGPRETPLLIDWTHGDSVTEGLRSDHAEAQGARILATALARASAAQSPTPLTLIAEGRGAFVALTALGQLSPAQRTVTDKRLVRLILVAPDIESELLTQELSHVDRSHTQTIIYAAKTARPLLASAKIYDARPIGLDPAQLSRINGVEAIEIGIGTDWTDFSTLWSNALISDMASSIKDGAPASKRCGLAHMAGAERATLFVLNPQGCALAASD